MTRESATPGGITDLGIEEGIVRMLAVYALVTIGGLLAWIPAVRLYYAARKVRRMRWALTMSATAVLIITSVAVAVGLAREGPVGVPLACGIAGMLALSLAGAAWWQAAVARTASDRLESVLADSPETAERLRQHWFFRRILRIK